jgi:hypothetical protein
MKIRKRRLKTSLKLMRAKKLLSALFYFISTIRPPPTLSDIVAVFTLTRTENCPCVLSIKNIFASLTKPQRLVIISQSKRKQKMYNLQQRRKLPTNDRFFVILKILKNRVHTFSIIIQKICIEPFIYHL